MHTTPFQRVLAAALLTGSALTVAVAGPATARVPEQDDPGVWGTALSELTVLQDPADAASIVVSLSPGSRDRVECATTGPVVRGNPYWLRLAGAGGWVSAALVDTDGRSVDLCTDLPSGDENGRGDFSLPLGF